MLVILFCLKIIFENVGAEKKYIPKLPKNTTGLQILGHDTELVKKVIYNKGKKEKSAEGGKGEMGFGGGMSSLDLSESDEVIQMKPPTLPMTKKCLGPQPKEKRKPITIWNKMCLQY